MDEFCYFSEMEDDQIYQRIELFIRSSEKKIKTGCYTFIKKYTLEFFLEKISQLTPHSNYKKKIYTKNAKSLKSTQKYFNETKGLKHIEIKEFSFLYFTLKNLKLIKNNLNLIQNVRLFSNENRIVFNEIVEKINHLDDPLLNDFNLDQQLIDRICKYASIKHILDNNKYDDYKKLDLLDEIIKDLKTYELEFRIEELESKFSKDLSESTFNEIRELKKLQKTN